eukprot:CAMPEP_0185775990 /NCGR_PEP_ID=MMETSP1174-20130828/84007_1 /TAXON_ID=35687 /ORGANISM="Dictyocha speculum, Strain CCMP1381" /LENGTH=101 /DNA_ID=CAMNT_0028463745 /DNA_START=364 /DNA_END=669 /DNA_ORIENTATION=+
MDQTHHSRCSHPCLHTATAAAAAAGSFYPPTPLFLFLLYRHRCIGWLESHDRDRGGRRDFIGQSAVDLNRDVLALLMRGAREGQVGGRGGGKAVGSDELSI